MRSEVDKMTAALWSCVYLLVVLALSGLSATAQPNGDTLMPHFLAIVIWLMVSAPQPSLVLVCTAALGFHACITHRSCWSCVSKQ